MTLLSSDQSRSHGYFTATNEVKVYKSQPSKAITETLGPVSYFNYGTFKLQATIRDRHSESYV
jgi:hypothetical protein